MEYDDLVLDQSFSFDSYLYTGGKVPKELRDSVVHVIVDSAVTEISAKAFTQCSSLSSIQLPDGLEIIGKAAFCNCQRLSSIDLPDGLKEIGEYAFSGCSTLSYVAVGSGTKVGNLAFSGCKLLSSELQRIMSSALNPAKSLAPQTPTSTYRYKGGMIPKDIRKTVLHVIIDSIVKKIDDRAFKDCTLLSSVDFHHGLEVIGKSAFVKCSSLFSVHLPNGLQRIDSFAFLKCSSLSSILLPDGLELIGACAFKGCSSLSSVEFPDGLTRIDENAFQDCSSLSSVEIPNKVNKISELCFQNCSSLSSVHFPTGLNEIHERAFDGCSSLSSVQLPNGLEEIGNGAFYNCSLLSSVQLPNGLKTIGENAFKYCSSISSVGFPNGLKRIGESAFKGCSSLSSAELASGLEIIGESAFSKCSSLSSVKLPDGLKTIDESTFQECSSLYSVHLPNQLNEIGESAFQDCSSLSSIHLPDRLKRIGESAFKGCSSLSSAQLPNGLEVIREHAFSKCSSLSSIRLPKQLREIHRYVFFKCSSLSSIKLPDGLKSIDESAFQECSSFSSIQLPNKLKEIDKSAFKGCSSLSYIQLPEGLDNIGSGAFEDCSSLSSVQFPSGLKKIEESAFKGCSSLASIELSNGTEAIGESAFSRCSSLSSVQLPNGLKEIDKYAFFDCSSLSSIEFPGELEMICACAFKGCSSLSTIEFPDDLEMIGSGAFQDCYSLVCVHFPDGVKKIGSGAFKGCSSLNFILLPNRLKEIGDYIFQDCLSIAMVEFPEGLKEIGKYTFKGCTSLSSLKLPKALKTIDESAFFRCSSLSYVQFPGELEVIGKSAFSHCSSLSSFKLPNGLKEIGYDAFKDCSSLSSVDFSDGLENIGGSAFEGCSSLSSVHVPNGLKMIEQFAFRDCISLTFVYFPDELTCVIARDAFLGCTLLASVTIPPKTTTIDNAFRNCKSLERTKSKKSFSVELLKSRFKDLPLHQACYEADEEQIEEFLTGVAARLTDDHNLLPLHILASNPKATGIMIRLVTDEYPDAITTNGAHGMSPLHFASINSGDHVVEFLPYLTKARTPGQGKLGSSLQNIDSRTPTVLSILYTQNEDVQRHLFERQPCNKSQFDEEIHDKVQKLEEWYVNHVTSIDSASDNFSFEAKHGWVKFVTDVVERNSITNICNFIKNADICPKTLVRTLADAKDDEDRKAIDVAVQEIKSAFFERLLFLSRYEIKSGAPIHKSNTCVVVEAFDMQGDEYYKKIFNKNKKNSSITKSSFRVLLKEENFYQAQDDGLLEKSFVDYDQNQDETISCDEFVNFCKDNLNEGKFRKVAIKFMQDEEQFQREIEYRKRNKELVKQKAVVEILENYNAAENKKFESAMESLEIVGSNEKLTAYRYAVVMPCADRNLDSIARSEKPGMNKIRSDSHQIAQKLSILHDNGIIHCDLKLQNIVRMGEKLVVIDLDASAKKKTTKESKLASYFVGKKFSSGILPPEMIYCLKEDDQKCFMDYFDHEDKKGWHWKKIKPMKSSSEDYFVVKTFEHEIEKIVDHIENVPVENLKIKVGLPYEPVEATTAIDLWSFGTILYFLCAQFPLFKVNVDDDLVDGDNMEKLCNWNDELKKEALNAIEESPAKTLLSRLLSKEPDARGTIADLLNDPFFNHNWDSSEKLFKRMSTIEATLVNKMNEVKEDVIRAAFEATEVTHPTTFVVLKVDLPNLMPTESLEYEVCDEPEVHGELVIDRKKVEKNADGALDALEALSGVCNWVDDLSRMDSDEMSTNEYSEKEVNTFFDAVKDKFNSLVTNEEQTMYLYLIDELTGMPVKADGYPITITRPSDFVPKMLPYIRNSLRIMSLYNGIACIPRMCGVPIPVVPAKSMKRLRSSVKRLHDESSAAEWKVVHDSAVEGGSDSHNIRGASLRQFAGFLEQHDPEKAYGGLRRIPGNDGVALWTAVPESEQKVYLMQRHANLLRAAQEREEELIKQEKEQKLALTQTETNFTTKFIELEKELDKKEVELDKKEVEFESKFHAKEAQIQKLEAEIRELKGGCACIIS